MFNEFHWPFGRLVAIIFKGNCMSGTFCYLNQNLGRSIGTWVDGFADLEVTDPFGSI